MPKETSVVEIPAHVRPILQAAAKNLLRHLYGPEGPAWGTSFATLEDLTTLLGDTLGTELLQQTLQLQASQPVPPPRQACPSCGRATQGQPPEPRSVQTRRGTVDWQEPTAHCDRCRKAFFPSVQELGD